MRKLREQEVRFALLSRILAQTPPGKGLYTHDRASILASNAKETLAPIIIRIVHPYITINSVERFLQL